MSGISVSTNLSASFGPVRDQGARPTCLAFAASDTHAALRSFWTPLSCEYAFFHAQRRANRAPTAGATLSAMLDTLRDDGQPPESAWSYLVPPVDAPQWNPPSNVTPLFRRAGESRSNSIDEILVELDKQNPVLVLMTLSSAFFAVGTSGFVDSTEPVEPTIRHAVVAVAHGDKNGERAVMVRNSWGPKWGNSGYAWITEKYLAPRVFRLAILKEDLSVLANSAAA